MTVLIELMRVAWHNMHHSPASLCLVFSYVTLSCALSLPFPPPSHSVDLVFYLPIFPFYNPSYFLWLFVVSVQYLSVCLSVCLYLVLSYPGYPGKGGSLLSLESSASVIQNMSRLLFDYLLYNKKLKIMWEGLYLLWKVKMRFLTICWKNDNKTSL